MTQEQNGELVQRCSPSNSIEKMRWTQQLR